MVIQGSKHPVELSLKAESFNSDIPHRVPEITQTFSKNDLKDTLEMVLPMGKMYNYGTNSIRHSIS